MSAHDVVMIKHFMFGDILKKSKSASNRRAWFKSFIYATIIKIANQDRSNWRAVASRSTLENRREVYINLM